MSLQKKPLAKRVSAYIKENHLISSGDTVIVGVSGGPDSVCLLGILQELASDLSINLHVAHLNHLLRGKEADADADYVRELAQKWNLPVTIARINVREYGESHRLSLEEAARDVRYQFFADVAEEIGAQKVAVGHTADDQVETIMMHLIRGSGIDGLRGIIPDIALKKGTTEELHLVRPLLTMTRQETEEYCRSNGLAVREDTTNILPDYMRNSVRHQLLPILRDYNSNLNNVLLRMASLAAQDLDFLETQVSAVWDTVVETRNNAFIVNTGKLGTLHPSLQYRLCREMLRRLSGQVKDIELRHIDKMVQALKLSPGKELSLPYELKLTVGYGQWFVGSNEIDWSPFPSIDKTYALKIPGETAIPGWRVVAKLQTKVKKSVTEWQADFDYQTVGNDLQIRARRDGDSFCPLGMERMKKLQDFMVDAKIPRLWRDNIPLICSPTHIIWVAGWRIDERAKVKPETTDILHLEFIPVKKR